jgi:hypothetical protein
MAGWRKGYCYEWNGIQWIELDPRTNSDKYMIALEDLLESAPDGAFNNLFCMNLIAQKAFVKYLQALDITLSELTENGQTKTGSIKSQNYRPGSAGFKIDYNGNAEFNDGVFRGDIHAKDGYFKGVIEAKTGIAGPWSTSPAMPSYMHVRAFGRFGINATDISPWGVSGNYIGAERLDSRTWLVKYNFPNAPQQNMDISPYLLAFTYGFWRIGSSFDAGRVVRNIDTTPGEGGWKIHLMKEDGTIYTPVSGDNIAVMFFAIL